MEWLFLCPKYGHNHPVYTFIMIFFVKMPKLSIFAIVKRM